MSFWTDLESAVKADVKVIEVDVQTIIKDIKPLVIASAEDVGKAALAAVVTAAPLVISGKEKLSAATSQIVSGLASNGKSVLASVAETAVQVAFNVLASSI